MRAFIYLVQVRDAAWHASGPLAPAPSVAAPPSPPGLGARAPRVHIMNTHFFSQLMGSSGSYEQRSARYDFAAVRTWTAPRALGRTGQSAPSPLDCDAIVVPVNLPGHWVCAAIDLRFRRFFFFDSMGQRRADVLEALARWVEDESRDGGFKNKPPREPIDTSEWAFVMPGGETPQQENCNDCGVFTLIFADFMARGLSPLAEEGDAGRFPDCLSQANMDYFRARIARDIIRERAE